MCWGNRIVSKVHVKKWHANIAFDSQSLNTRQTRDFAIETGNTETLSSDLDSEVIKGVLNVISANGVKNFSLKISHGSSRDRCGTVLLVSIGSSWRSVIEQCSFSKFLKWKKDKCDTSTTTCVDNTGDREAGYKCQCKPGYSKTESHWTHCVPNSCPAGYELHPLTGYCMDIDECRRGHSK